MRKDSLFQTVDTSEKAALGPMSKPQHRRWPIVGCSLVACFLVGLVYLLQLTPTSPPLILPGHRHQVDEATRPRIEVHPENHIYRAPVTHHLNWRVTSGYRRPDGVSKRVYLINNLFPGPTVESRSGDTLIINVTNDLPEESIAFHWHGLHVANGMDGAVAVSQCPIAAGEQFLYNLTIPASQSGTFWYHSHSGVSRADGLYGGLVVHAPASKSAVRGRAPGDQDGAHHLPYDKEVLLLIGDWYHRSARDVLDWYTDPGNFGNEPVPDSLLINGVGYFDCKMAVTARPVDCMDQALISFLDLNPRLKYRIRVVNTGSLAGFSLKFDYWVDLIQVDSVDVERPRDEDINSIGILYPGQRMDFILRPPPQNAENELTVAVQLDQECFKYANPALTPNQTFPLSHKPRPLSDAQTKSSIRIHHLNIQDVPSSSSILQAIPHVAQQTHVVYTKIQKMARHSNRPLGYFNQTTWSPQKDPSAPLVSLPRKEWDTNQFVISTGPSPAWVDLVINNLDEGSHPFHLHGHHFYVLKTHQSEYGWGSYNPFVDEAPPHLSSETDLRSKVGHDSEDASIPLYDLNRAALRDTVQIPSRGYAVLRFRADNPGVWLLHCHVLWHSATGMAMLIDVQDESAGLAAHDVESFSNAGGLCPFV